MEIPYTVKARPDTGLPNAKLGIWLFLASEVMLFGALFSSYILLRINATEWPIEMLSVPMACTNTVILITSSITMVMAWASLAMNDFKKYKCYMLVTILLACGFLVVKYFEYTGKFANGIYPKTNTFFATYFLMTGLHVLHVIGGIVCLAWHYGPGAKMWETEPERFTGRVEVTGLYWHFVDLVWIFLFPSLYLM